MNKRASNDRCPEGGLMHAAGECPWCDQKRADEYRDASIRLIQEAREKENDERRH